MEAELLDDVAVNVDSTRDVLLTSLDAVADVTAAATDDLRQSDRSRDDDSCPLTSSVVAGDVSWRLSLIHI